MFFSWGAPAFTMTQKSFDDIYWVNDSYFCLYDDNKGYNQFNKYKDMFGYLYSTSLISHLLWTIVLFTSMIWLQNY